LKSVTMTDSISRNYLSTTDNYAGCPMFAKLTWVETTAVEDGAQNSGRSPGLQPGE
jgi:hypothetical protein